MPAVSSTAYLRKRCGMVGRAARDGDQKCRVPGADRLAGPFKDRIRGVEQPRAGFRDFADFIEHMCRHS